MISKMSNYRIITSIKEGESFRAVSKKVGVDRKTISKIWQAYKNATQELEEGKELSRAEMEDLVSDIVQKRKYRVSGRAPKKLTEAVKNEITQILELEKEKLKLFGINTKQKLTIRQIYQLVQAAGYDVGETTIRNYLATTNQSRSVFIKQEYEYGKRLEYDFGEVKLVIDGVVGKYYMAVLASPACKYRYAYLYESQDQKVFMDSHVKFFEMIGGVYREVVYDNMRNVIKKFVGRHEKELNEKLVNLALYYGFSIKVTNCYSGNEKGYVEGSVKELRKQIFSKEYKFQTLDDARKHLADTLVIINESSNVEIEKTFLLKGKPKFELAEISEHYVDKYSCIRLENNFYSVPDYLIAKTVIVKNYLNEIVIYSKNTLVCEHKKIDGYMKYQLVINHYLNTLKRKPNALVNSLVLKQQPQLQAIYQDHFSTKPKEFIEILLTNRNNSTIELIKALENHNVTSKVPRDTISNEITQKSKEQLHKISLMCSEQEGVEYGTN